MLLSLGHFSRLGEESVVCGEDESAASLSSRNLRNVGGGAALNRKFSSLPTPANLRKGRKGHSLSTWLQPRELNQFRAFEGGTQALVYFQLPR